MFDIKRIISGETNTPAQLLYMQIREILMKEGYRIVDRKDKKIEFEDADSRIFEIRGASSGKLKSGEIFVDESEGKSLVVLSFRFTYKYLLLVCLILILLGIIYDYFAFFTLIFVVVTFKIEMGRQKRTGLEIIDRIVDKSPPAGASL